MNFQMSPGHLRGSLNADEGDGGGVIYALPLPLNSAPEVKSAIPEACLPEKTRRPNATAGSRVSSIDPKNQVGLRALLGRKGPSWLAQPPFPAW